MSDQSTILHVYLADQDWETTSSLGIYHFARKWLETFLRRIPSGWQVVVTVLPSERDRFLPAELPESVTVVELRGPRLWRDHVLCPWVTLRRRANRAFFPKGWLPLWMPSGVHITCIMHDCMQEHYQSYYPGFLSWPKYLYFRCMARHTLRRATELLTISDFSMNQIQNYYHADRQMRVIPEADPLPPPSQIVPPGKRRGILVLGSNLPHKRVPEALSLLQAWRSRSHFDEPIYLTGEQKFDSSLLDGVERLGLLSDQELSDRIASVRALVHLSELEGFGLPLLEAWFRHTPVLFRNAHSFQEIMGEDAPGGWSGGGVEEFSDKLTEVLALTESQIAEQADRLKEKFTWGKCVNHSLRSWM
jgi:hypothetical protein